MRLALASLPRVARVIVPFSVFQSDGSGGGPHASTDLDAARPG